MWWTSSSFSAEEKQEENVRYFERMHSLNMIDKIQQEVNQSCQTRAWLRWRNIKAQAKRANKQEQQEKWRDQEYTEQNATTTKKHEHTLFAQSYQNLLFDRVGMKLKQVSERRLIKSACSRKLWSQEAFIFVLTSSETPTIRHSLSNPTLIKSNACPRVHFLRSLLHVCMDIRYRSVTGRKWVVRVLVYTSYNHY